MLNLADHENFPAQKEKQLLAFYIYEQEKSIIGLSEPEKNEFLDIVILMSI